MSCCEWAWQPASRAEAASRNARCGHEGVAAPPNKAIWQPVRHTWLALHTLQGRAHPWAWADSGPAACAAGPAWSGSQRRECVGFCMKGEHMTRPLHPRGNSLSWHEELEDDLLHCHGEIRG